MTDQQYTPSLEEVRDATSLFRSRFFDQDEFDRWHAAEIAAAEQRGAARGKVEGLREAADEAGSWGPACINAALAIRRSADLLEGDGVV